MSEQTQQPPAPATPDSDPHAPEHHFQHEADKTELEKWLNAGLSKVEPYSNYILIGFIGVTVLLVAGIFWSQSAGASRTAQWEEFVENRVPEDYLAIADNNPDSPVGSWALLQAGRGFLQEGMRNSLTNRETSDARLQEASDAFEKLLKRSNVPSAAREEALLGLGTAREVLEGDKPSSAIEAYQKLVDGFPESRHVPWANQRIKELQEESTQEFYAWFRKQNPNPGDRPLPSDFLPKKTDIPEAAGLLDLLEESDLKLPSTGEGEANTKTVPTEEEMKKEGAKADEKDSKVAKPFPPKEDDKKAAEKAKAETPKEKEADPKPEEKVKEEATEAKADPAPKTEKKEAAPKETSEAPAKPAEKTPEKEAAAATPEKTGDDK